VAALHFDKVEPIMESFFKEFIVRYPVPHYLECDDTEEKAYIAKCFKQV